MPQIETFPLRTQHSRKPPTLNLNGRPANNSYAAVFKLSDSLTSNEFRDRLMILYIFTCILNTFAHQ
jgi:hypothetical protein